MVEEFQKQLTEDGFGDPTRSMYFFWVDRYIIDHKELTRETMHELVKGMVDGRFIHDCEIYDSPEEQYLIVCKFTLSLYEIVFFLPSREEYLKGEKYFMRLKGKIDLVSLRQLFKVFRVNLS